MQGLVDCSGWYIQRWCWRGRWAGWGRGDGVWDGLGYAVFMTTMTLGVSLPLREGIVTVLETLNWFLVKLWVVICVENAYMRVQ
jgi:hypothetical protein